MTGSSGSCAAERSRLVRQHPSSAQMFNTHAHKHPLFLARGPSEHRLLFGAAFTVATTGRDGGGGGVQSGVRMKRKGNKRPPVPGVERRLLVLLNEVLEPAASSRRPTWL